MGGLLVVFVCLGLIVWFDGFVVRVLGVIGVYCLLISCGWVCLVVFVLGFDGFGLVFIGWCVGCTGG